MSATLCGDGAVRRQSGCSDRESRKYFMHSGPPSIVRAAVRVGGMFVVTQHECCHAMFSDDCLR